MILRLVLAAVALAVVAGMAWVRLAPTEPARWHVDPLTVADPPTPNFARLSLVLPEPVPAAAARVEAAMRAMPRTVLIAGSAEEGWMTFRTRSRLIGYPDFTSIRVLPEADGARVVAFARSRFGRSDLGVNAARLAALRAALE